MSSENKHMIHYCHAILHSSCMDRNTRTTTTQLKNLNLYAQFRKKKSHCNFRHLSVSLKTYTWGKPSGFGINKWSRIFVFQREIFRRTRNRNRKMEDKLAIYMEFKRHLVVSRTQSFLQEPFQNYDALSILFHISLNVIRGNWDHMWISVLQEVLSTFTELTI